jgi:hypothetical protein
MNKPKYDLAVAYRIYPRVSKIPAIFPEDKLRLARLCLHSFKASLGAVRAKIFVLLDGCPPEFDAIFTECFDTADLELIRLSGVGNRQTFLRQIDILLKQDNAETIYFAEDDYFYLANQFEQMLNFLRDTSGADFVSPYDHPDYYRLALHAGSQEVCELGDRRWHTAASTCLTFLTTKQTLAQTRRVFETYAHGNPDVCLWLSLTKQALFDPRLIWRSFREGLTHGGFLAVSWLYGWPQILAGRRRKLWVPTPSIATHTEEKFLAPGVNWKAQFENGLKFT